MKFTKDEDGVAWGTVVVRHRVTRDEYKQMVGWATFEKGLDRNATQAEVAEMLDSFLSSHLDCFDPEDAGYEPAPEHTTQDWQLGQA